MPTNHIAQLASRFRKAYPDVRFRIKRKKLTDAAATAECTPNGQFIITLASDLQDYVAPIILVHELAHLLSWHMDQEEHGDAFWAAHRQTYRLFEKWIQEV